MHFTKEKPRESPVKGLEKEYRKSPEKEDRNYDIGKRK